MFGSDERPLGCICGPGLFTNVRKLRVPTFSSFYCIGSTHFRNLTSPCILEAPFPNAPMGAIKNCHHFQRREALPAFGWILVTAALDDKQGVTTRVVQYLVLLEFLSFLSDYNLWHNYPHRTHDQTGSVTNRWAKKEKIVRARVTKLPIIDPGPSPCFPWVR